MNDLLIGLLSALLSTNSPAAASVLLRSTLKTMLPAPASLDPVDVEFKRVMEMDDKAREDIDLILQQNQADQAKQPELKRFTVAEQMETKVLPVRKAYDLFLEKHPKHAKARIAYGSFLTEISEEQAGVTQWIRAKELDPKEPSAWNNLANYYGHHGPMTNALVHYARAIELDPSESVYFHNLATTMYMFRVQSAEFLNKSVNEVMDTAMAAYRKARELDPHNFVLASDVAQSYYGLPGFKGAKTPEEFKVQRRISEEALVAWTNAFALARDEVERQGVQLHFARLNLHLGRSNVAWAALTAVTNTMFTPTKSALTRKLEDFSPPPNP